MSDINVVVTDATPQNVVVSTDVTTINEQIVIGGGGGSSYDQSLNTTDSPSFSALTIANGYDGASTYITGTGITINDGDNHASVSANAVSGTTDNGHGGTYYLNGNGVTFAIGDDTNTETPTSVYGHGVIEYTTASTGSKTFTLPTESGTLALTSDVRSFGGVGYVFVTVTGNDVAPPPGGYYVITNSSNYYTQDAIYIHEVNQSAKIYYSSGSWRLLNAATGTEYVQSPFDTPIPPAIRVINYTGTDSNGSPCSCSITFSSYFQSARPVSTVGNGSTNSAGTSQLVAHADHSHALASNVVTLTGQQTLTNKSITSSQIIGLATVATSGSASDLGTGTLSDNRLSSNIPRMSGGLIQASNLPSYVDDVLEYTETSNFPATGESGKIYVATGTGLIYRWTGSIYVEISPSTAQVQSDWNASSGLGVILNKPSLATVATSGSASDLGTGTLPDARLSSSVVTLTGTQTLTNKSISSGQITGLASVATSGAYSSLSGTPSLASVATSGSASDLGTGTLPDARLSTNVVTLTGTQTLTNKSISAAQITGLGTASAKDIPATGNASATQVVYGSDTRLTDARTPSAHTHPLSDLTQSSATTGQVATWNGTAWAAATPASSTDASALTTGTLADARLSSNVTLLTSSQTLTNKTLTTPNVGNGSTNAILTAFTANILSVANSTTACGFSVFNTRTDASNYEAGIFDFTTNANSLTIGTTKAGTGTARRVRINSAEQIDFYCTDTSRMFQVSTSAVTSYNSFGFQWFSSASDPTTSSTPFSNGTSYCAVYKNTTSGVVSLWVRDGSTMKKVALA
jgi:hypothetical protein